MSINFTCQLPCRPILATNRTVPFDEMPGHDLPERLRKIRKGQKDRAPKGNHRLGRMNSVLPVAPAPPFLPILLIPKNP